MEDKQVLVIGGIVAAVAYALWKSRQVSAEYMEGDSENPEYTHSTDDDGGTLYYQQGPIGGNGHRVQANIGIPLAPKEGRGRAQDVYCRCPSCDYLAVLEEGSRCNEVWCPKDKRPLVPAGIGVPPHPRRATYHQAGSSRGRQEENIEAYAVDYPYFIGGTFINPGVLPPVRTARLQ